MEGGERSAKIIWGGDNREKSTKGLKTVTETDKKKGEKGEMTNQTQT